MDYLFHPEALIESGKELDGSQIVFDVLPQNVVNQLAKEVAYDWTDDWGTEHGFGSSDFTYALKEFMDILINYKRLPFKTDFNPYLSIVKK